MTAHQWTVDQWAMSIASALSIGDVKAVPTIMLEMALDGWPSQAEQVRQQVLVVLDSRDAFERTDREAATQLQILLDAYKTGGMPALRVAALTSELLAAPAARVQLLVEAVVTIGEQRALDEFDAAETADEAFRASER